jgi:hypothetical protein
MVSQYTTVSLKCAAHGTVNESLDHGSARFDGANSIRTLQSELLKSIIGDILHYLRQTKRKEAALVIRREIGTIC